MSDILVGTVIGGSISILTLVIQGIITKKIAQMQINSQRTQIREERLISIRADYLKEIRDQINTITVHMHTIESHLSYLTRRWDREDIQPYTDDETRNRIDEINKLYNIPISNCISAIEITRIRNTDEKLATYIQNAIKACELVDVDIKYIFVLRMIGEKNGYEEGYENKLLGKCNSAIKLVGDFNKKVMSVNSRIEEILSGE